MNYMDEYRDRRTVLGLAQRIGKLASGRTAPMTFMEVCGTHTMAIYQYGIRSLLPPQVRLISGPGCPVCVTPNSYVDKERAVRACENIYAVGDSVGMCRFTTKLFNSPSLPGIEEFREQLANVTGLQFSDAELEQCGLNIMGVERLINHRLGVRRKDDTLPDRWFDEANPSGPYKGEKIDRLEFEAMLTRFYEISRLTSEGVPQDAWRKELQAALGA